jgi:membrane associated rhomboid family serine protease
VISGGLLLPLLQWASSPLLPPGLRVNHYELFSVAALAGLIGGLYLAILARFLRRRELGLRSQTSYPAIKDLRKLGWDFPSSD